MASELEERLKGLRPGPIPPAEVTQRVLAAVLNQSTTPSRSLSLLTEVTPRWHRLVRTRLIVLAACIGAALTIAAVVVRDSDSSEGLSRFSTIGEPVEWEPAYRQSRVPRLLSTRSGRAFYTMPSSDGVLCFGVGTLKQDLLTPGSLTCPLHRGIFPSPAEPVLFHVGRVASQASGITLVDVEGFAADGVARIELRLPGLTLTAPVESNTFAIEVNRANVTSGALVGLAPDGEVVYRQDLAGPPARQ